MRHILLFLFFFPLFFTTGFAQVVISGKVVQEENGQPLPKASVYLNNSTIGTVTDEQGAFSLTTAKSGFADLVVTYIGYEVLVHPVRVGTAPLRFVFRLKPKEKELRDVLVLGKDTRKKWLKIFRENFIGVTPAALRCTLTNEEEIRFAAGERKGAIQAFSDVPLLVENRELGYRVSFHLLHFSFDPEDGQTFFYGFSRFEELKGDARKRWRKNRERYYFGSTAHFFDALIRNRLEEEDFLIRIIRQVKDGASKAPDTAGGKAGRDSARMISVAYPAAQKDVLRMDSTASHHFLFDFPGKLQVLYKKNPPFKEAMKRTGFLPPGNGSGTTSYIELLNAPVVLDGSGLPENPVALRYSGFWMYEKLGNMLPVNYVPGR